MHRNFPQRQTSPINHRVKCSPKPSSTWNVTILFFFLLYFSLIHFSSRITAYCSHCANELRVVSAFWVYHSHYFTLAGDELFHKEWTLCPRQQSLLVRACWTIWLARWKSRISHNTFSRNSYSVRWRCIVWGASNKLNTKDEAKLHFKSRIHMRVRAAITH